MQIPVKKLLMLSLLACLLQAGCNRSTRDDSSKGTPRSAGSASAEYQQIVDKISDIVGDQLNLNPSEVDVDRPLSQQKNPADDLDVVEIIMTVEQAFDIPISDEEVARDLSVRKLADIVSRKKS
ncbi:MAG TPA: phosphopantetheine-binding protein [Pyrinomonadaceae bacterium]|nr:phosphopantetheine-binding protein [Pyrinomonadaceae bacterium]